MPREVNPHPAFRRGRQRRASRLVPALVSAALAVLGLSCSSGSPTAADPYASYVWPAPPDKPRIGLVTILHGRDVETSSGLKRALLASQSSGPYDWLQKPFAVELDEKGRILVTDPAVPALFRFDRQGRRLDVFGTRGRARLKLPLGLGLTRDGKILVADAALKQVVVLDAEGNFAGTYGGPGELENPTDVAVSSDGKKVFVADSKAHRIAVFDAATGKLERTFGRRGQGDGEFNFPTALVFGPEGDLYVVDQASARVQIFAPSGEYLDGFGGRGVAYGAFVRPKDVAVDEAGIVYVPDAAFNNVQLFDPDLRLLMFFGAGGVGPGEFQQAAAVAVRGDEIVVVDQLNRRIQVFRYLVPKGAGPSARMGDFPTGTRPRAESPATVSATRSSRFVRLVGFERKNGPGSGTSERS